MLAEFRCLSCTAISELDAPEGTLTLGMKARPQDAAAPNCPCGAKAWVLVGSMTEFYRYTGRGDTCRVGDHHDPRARPYRLLPRQPATGELRVVSLNVNVCPDHVDVLRTQGILGFYLVD